MAVTKVRKHNRVINGKVVAVRGTSRVVGKPGPKIAEAKVKSVKVKIAEPAPKTPSPFMILQPETVERIRKLCDERAVTADTLISVALRSIETSKGRHFDLETPMGFGKYAAETFESVVRLDPNYIRWLLESTKGTTLTDRAQSFFNIWMHGG